jgi:hypothetical protein
MTPQISIITPLYNKENYIRQTIESVLCQSFPNWEMLVIDNGSTDASFDIAQQFDDQRIHFFQCPKRGPGSARNYGIKLAKGNWIQFLDADDLLEPNHLEQQLETAKKNPEADIIACYWQEFTDENPQNKILKKPTGIGQPIEVLRNAAIAFPPWTVHAAIIKKSVLSPDCYWTEQLDQLLGEDIAFWYKLISKSQISYSSSQGVLYRTQTPQCRTQNSNPQKWFEGIHTAIQCNLDYFKSQNEFYTANQCENLMRVYSGIYTMAKRKKSHEIESQSLNEANKWLNAYFEVANQSKIPMLIRRILGLPLFLILANLFNPTE